MKRDLMIITTGGTIFQKYNASSGSMEILANVDHVLDGLQHPPNLTLPIAAHNINARSGADLTFETVYAVLDAVAGNPQHTGYLLVTGTDTMDEFAFMLSLLLNFDIIATNRTFVVVGAMKPADTAGYDGPPNLQDGVRVACCPSAAACGVLVVMNDNIHLASYVQKADSQLIGSFQSHPGPIGQIRSGNPVFYYSPPAALTDPKWDFSGMKLGCIQRKVCVWTITVSSFLPECLLEELDGLVIAGAGTGSLPSAMIEQLSQWTSKLPIAIVSRCPVGANFDDCYYRGSRQRYTSRGFLLDDYEHLNAVQARALLIFQISKYGAQEFLLAAQQSQQESKS